MTGVVSDPLAWQAHIRQAAQGTSGTARQAGQGREGPTQSLVIVCDMWLEPASMRPSMHTMYVDKPMRGPRADAGHRPRQTASSVTSPPGWSWDYIGIAQNLKKCAGQYSGGEP